MKIGSVSALTETSTLKTIITLEGKLDLERKGQQSYQGDVYARLLAFGNGSLQSLYDHTDAFYRRQLIMVAKPVQRQENDPNLIDQAGLKHGQGLQFPGRKERSCFGATPKVNGLTLCADLYMIIETASERRTSIRRPLRVSRHWKTRWRLPE